MFFMFLFITGCSSNVNNETKPPETYLSDEENHYSLLIINDESMADIDWFDWKDKNKIRNVSGISQNKTTLKKAKEHFKFLELEKLPCFVAFDTKDIAYQTNNEKQLIEFLQKNVPESWNH